MSRIVGGFLALCLIVNIVCVCSLFLHCEPAKPDITVDIAEIEYCEDFYEWDSQGICPETEKIEGYAVRVEGRPQYWDKDFHRIPNKDVARVRRR